MHTPVVRDALEQVVSREATLEFVEAELCRRELLVEIEGIATCRETVRLSAMRNTTLNTEPPEATLLTSAYGAGDTLARRRNVQRRRHWAQRDRCA